MQKSKKDIAKQKQLEEKEQERIRKSGIYAVSVWKYDYSFGKPDKKGVELSFNRFDSKGRRVEEKTFNPADGSVVQTINCRYNSDDQVIEEVKAKGDEKTKTVYRYDSTGNRKEAVSYKPDGSVDRKSVFSYDDDGNLLESKGYLSDGHLFSKETYAYDSLGNVIEQKNSLDQFTYRYDDDGNMVELVKYRRDFNSLDSLVYVVSDRLTFEYDSLGNMTAQIVYKPDSSIKARSKYFYDDDWNLVNEVDYSFDNRVDYTISYTYDRRQNVVEEWGTDKGRPFRNIYRFDRRGNKREWISYDQVNEPRTMTKYLYEKYSVLVKKTAPDSNLAAEFVQPDTAESHVVNEDLFQFLGCRIIASDGTYLGLVWADTTHPHSIVNPWGQYGFEGSPTSIFNPNCPYGGLHGVFSPFNRDCPSPPSLYREGKFVSYLSDNTAFHPCVPASRLMTFLMQQVKSKE
ncbi:MAG TPA: hypothetical protein VMM58_09090 [Bacteroidota bacterium]|nr:hypothetical protein [Bacteroidota bacterium]